MDKMKRGILISLMLLMFIGLTNAAHVITPTTISVNESVNHVYKITIENTDISGAITQVNITFPVLFQFAVGSEKTDAVFETFVNTSNILSWTHATSLVAAGEAKYFQFNATVPLPEDYTLTITTLNSTGSYSSTISVEVNDTTAPTINFVSPTPANNSVVNDSSLKINVSADDNSGIDTIKIFLYNSGGLVNSVNGTGIAFFIATFNGLSSGTYWFNATVNDTSGYVNSTATRMITINYTVSTCTENWTIGSWGSCINGTQIRTVNDSNNCGTTVIKPNATQSCTEICTPQWEFGNWSECSQEGKQTRTVTDENDCNVTTGKPAEEKACEYESPQSGKIWIFIIVLMGVIMAISGIAYLIIYLISKSLEPAV